MQEQLMPEQKDRFAQSSAALSRMISIAEIDWEAEHGHPAPCPPGCLIRIAQEQKVQEVWGSVQPIPNGRTTEEELMSSHGRSH